MINHRLFDHYGIDTTKDLQMRESCARPFDTILIDKTGSCFACECTAWLPQSIGNLQVRGLSNIIGSLMHRELQTSIQDGSYRYCNQAQCSYLKKGRFYEQTQTEIKHIRLAIDDSCNLKCPSCRKGMIFHKQGAQFDLGIKLADRVNEWLHGHERNIQVHIGSDGDPFASHVYRHFMEKTPKRENIKYSILTNGLMFKEFHTKVPTIMNNLQELGVSIDGASKDTYEKLRLGGKWEKIIEGMECMAEQKQKNNFKFTMHMVVQKDNWHELEAMLELGHTYGVDMVYFNHIEDWNTDIDIDLQTFTQLDEFKKSIRRISADPIVWNNVATLT
tara:strand:+ start:303 stop:1298 length:996 start_codon:yes stop_codon:yes gene_type:complete